jgi:hypothetical protein
MSVIPDLDVGIQSELILIMHTSFLMLAVFRLSAAGGPLPRGWLAKIPAIWLKSCPAAG